MCDINVEIADFLEILRASSVSDKVKCEMLGKLSAIRNKQYNLTHLSLNYPHSEFNSDDDVPELEYENGDIYYGPQTDYDDNVNDNVPELEYEN